MQNRKKFRKCKIQAGSPASDLDVRYFLSANKIKRSTNRSQNLKLSILEISHFELSHRINPRPIKPLNSMFSSSEKLILMY